MVKLLQSMQTAFRCKSLLAAIALTASVFATAPELFASGNAATQGGSESKKISISVKNASLEEVLLLLKEKSNCYFLYNSNAVRKISGITLKAQNASVETILKSCLHPTPFEYTIKEGTIVIKAKPGQEEFVEAADREAKQRRTLTGRVITKQGRQPLAGVAVF